MERTTALLRDMFADRLVPNRGKFGILLLLSVLLAVSQETSGLVMNAMADAYLQVTVFVAATLAVFYAGEKLLKTDLGAWMARSRRWQPAIAALLGALPGCGGAIMVVTQFTRGNASFGALISVLVATMGDAAFLLIAREPSTALMVIAISLVTGTISGMAVDRIHPHDFLRPRAIAGDIARLAMDTSRRLVPKGGKIIWLAMLAPGVVLGGMIAFQTNPDVVLGIPGFTVWFGFIGAALSLILWSLSAGGKSHTIGGGSYDLGTRIAADTNFVTAWVVMAFLTYEFAVFWLGTDISTMFQAWAPFTPLVAILVGFIPGCGPQIVVTTLYLAGAIPLSAQLSNAIANDGDALFPAIALAPRAAILATLYSAIPALIVGYGWFVLFE
ncbi:MAG: putative manganese transporter, partial [Alphaproteobacteria bacterium]